MPTLVERLRAAGCVFAEEEAALLEGAATGPDLEHLVRRRVAGEPLEHLLGWAAFDGGRVLVEPGVFIPRQRTAYLVELAHAALTRRAGARPGTVLDLCCGSGALGLALARRRPGVVLHASDLDPAAVACATRNLAEVGGVVHHGDLDAALPPTLRGQLDIVLANVPFVPSDAVPLMPAESRDHEPVGTVDGGADGLDLLRRVATIAPTWLRSGGSVLCEVAPAQVDTALAAFAAAGLTGRAHHDDEREATVVSGRAP